MNGSTIPSDAIASECTGKLKKKKDRAKEKNLQLDPSAAMEVEACGDDDNIPPKNASVIDALDQEPFAIAQEPNAKLLDDK